jgi:tripartite-type tricarboxylate transporter receptor subunit TctC
VNRRAEIIQGGTHTINPALYKKLPYDAQRDFTAIALVALAPVTIISGATID